MAYLLGVYQTPIFLNDTRQRGFAFVIAQLREREPAMRALAKRVAQHAPGAVTAEAKGASAATNLGSGAKNSWARGPRNQPKRKRR